MQPIALAVVQSFVNLVFGLFLKLFLVLDRVGYGGLIILQCLNLALLLRLLLRSQVQLLLQLCQLCLRVRKLLLLASGFILTLWQRFWQVQSTP